MLCPERMGGPDIYSVSFLPAEMGVEVRDSARHTSQCQDASYNREVWALVSERAARYSPSLQLQTPQKSGSLLAHKLHNPFSLLLGPLLGPQALAFKISPVRLHSVRNKHQLIGRSEDSLVLQEQR